MKAEAVRVPVHVPEAMNDLALHDVPQALGDRTRHNPTAAAFELNDLPRRRRRPCWACGLGCCLDCYAVDEDAARPETLRGVQKGNDAGTVRPYWYAWANQKDLSCYPQEIRSPRSLPELQQAVRDAAAKGLKVRVAGQGHSSTPLVATDGMLITMDKLLRYRVDKPNKRITVTAGVDVNGLDRLLAKEGLALPNNIVLTSVQIGGVIQAGCHGSGRRERTTCELVQSLQVVDSTGALRTFARDQPGAHPDIFEAAVCALGTFGVVYTLTLQAVDNVWVKAVDRIEGRAVLTDSKWLRRTVLGNDVVDLFWWPYTDRVWVRTVNAARGGLAGGLQRLAGRVRAKKHTPRKILEGTQAAFGSATLAGLLRKPETTPDVMNFIAGFVGADTDIVTLRESVHYQRFIPSFGVEFMEVAFPVDGAFERVARACTDLFDTVELFRKAGRYPMNLTAQLRFAASSTALLSATHRDDATETDLWCWIEVVTVLDTPDYGNFVRVLGPKWMAIEGALPHWPKRFENIPGIAEQMRQRRGDRLERFRRARAAARVHPDNMFSNAFTDRHVTDRM